jgi:uncharacterized protein YutE (UPF0331/DUF86 family)
MDDIVLNKVATIERCLHRVGEEYAGRPENLEHDITRQDSIVLNIQRACEASIVLAMHLVRRFALGVPQDRRNAFDLLVDAGKLDAAMADALKLMVGFRKHRHSRLSAAEPRDRSLHHREQPRRSPRVRQACLTLADV